MQEEVVGGSEEIQVEGQVMQGEGQGIIQEITGNAEGQEEELGGGARF